METLIAQLIIALALLSQTISSHPVLAETVHSTSTPQALELSDNKVLDAISLCESRNRQFNKDGTVLRGNINPKDVGKYQINEYWHLEASKKMNIDIYTLEGNTEYAHYLYEKQGTKPWNSSKHCWSKLLGLGVDP